MAKVQASRFALLHVDDSDSDDSKKKKGAKPAGQQQAAAKKRNKKKKGDQQKENEQLRSLAFSKSTKPKAGISVSGKPVGLPAGPESVLQPTNSDQWEEWQRVDKGFAADTYQKDLQQALMLSKLEKEEQKQRKISQGEDDDGKGQGHKGKKKGKKDKPAAMSLEQFHQSAETDKTKPEENGCKEDSPRKPTTSISEPDPAFFEDVDEDAQKIIRKEKIQAEYQKQYIVENVRSQQYEENLSKKDTEIKRLKAENKKLTAELKEVRERNQQLCGILAQGEMKGKTAVLLELDELKSVRDELTAEVSSLTSELEKERSKVHALKTAADKTKSGKHGK